MENKPAIGVPADKGEKYLVNLVTAFDEIDKMQKERERSPRANREATLSFF